MKISIRRIRLAIACFTQDNISANFYHKKRGHWTYYSEGEQSEFFHTLQCSALNQQVEIQKEIMFKGESVWTQERLNSYEPTKTERKFFLGLFYRNTIGK